uniref:Uncharacterized protein n=1 Tax=Caenorhabditis japonica TaxID=281687 RepID=A0A8R1ECY3_CAEJA
MSFKSDFHLKAVINITTTDTPLLIPFTVSPNETETLSRIPIDFVGIEEYRLTIFVINEDKQDNGTAKSVTASAALKLLHALEKCATHLDSLDVQKGQED